MHILLIDDDEAMGMALKDYLSNHGFSTTVALHPRQGIEMLHQSSFDCVLLDLMLPDINGLEVCRIIRRDFNCPIIMVTAKGDLHDKIIGLEIGADDYLPKPYEPRELVARLKSVLRRNRDNYSPKYRFILDETKRVLIVGKTSVELTETEVDIVSCLMKAQGQPLSRRMLYQQIKGLDTHVEVETRAIDHAVSRLRRKLSSAHPYHKYIQTVRGRGYIFVEER
jgi:DNA-binding response OmpR family regulator